MSLLDSLVSYWKLDEASGNALDAHGGNDLTAQGSPGTNTGVINTCRVCDASTKYFSRSGTTDFSPGDVSWSFSCWAYFTNLGGQRGVAGSDGSFWPWYLYANGSGGFQFWIHDSSDNEYLLDATSFGTLSTGTWYHVVCWHDAENNEIGIAVNGISDTAFWDTGIKSSSGLWRLGQGPSGLGNNHKRVDEAALWHRALSPSEISQLYNGGAGLAYEDFAPAEIVVELPLLLAGATLLGPEVSAPVEVSLPILYVAGDLVDAPLGVSAGVSLTPIGLAAEIIPPTVSVFAPIAGYIHAVQVATMSSGTDLVIPRTFDPDPGDLLLVLVMTYPVLTFTEPAGWSYKGVSVTPEIIRRVLYGWMKDATDSEPASYTWTRAESGPATAVLLWVKGPFLPTDQQPAFSAFGINNDTPVAAYYVYPFSWALGISSVFLESVAATLTDYPLDSEEVATSIHDNLTLNVRANIIPALASSYYWELSNAAPWGSMGWQISPSTGTPLVLPLLEVRAELRAPAWGKVRVCLRECRPLFRVKARLIPPVVNGQKSCLVISTDGQLALLNSKRVYLDTLTLRLFVNDRWPVVGDQVGDYQEASFQGYQARLLKGWQLPRLIKGVVTSLAPIQTWTWTGGAEEDVYGWFVQSPTGHVIFAARLIPKRRMKVAGDTISVQVRLTEKTENTGE